MRSRGFGTFLVFVGSCLLMSFAWQLVVPDLVAEARQAKLRHAFEQAAVEPVAAQDERAPRATARPADRALAPILPMATLPPRAKPLGPGGPKPIARVRIPRIGVDQIVLEGVSLERLSYGPGRYPTSERFGARGASAIAGHRTGWGSPFVDLDRLRAGDAITVETRRERLTYRVSAVRVVRPSATWVLEGNPASRARSQLVLTTCTPKYTDRDRLIVFADLVGRRAR